MGTALILRTLKPARMEDSRDQGLCVKQILNKTMFGIQILLFFSNELTKKKKKITSEEL